MKSFKNYPSALRQDVLQWIKDIGDLDILVGIPAFNNEDTIKNVVETVAQGLKEFYPDAKAAILVSDGGSLDDTRETAESARVPEGIHRKVTIYRGTPGKGTSFRAIFELASRCKADACVVVDSDLRSIQPDWIHLLTQPILERQADFVAPLYARHKYDGTITNHIVYPITRALFGKDIRQPIGGDFGFSGLLATFYAQQDVWTTDVAKFGIDIWMTISAVAEGYRVMQAHLGAKIHDPKDPAEDLGPMFQQVVSTLFYLIGQYESYWKNIHQTVTVEVVNNIEETPKIPPVAVTLSKMEHEFRDGFEYFRPLYETVLSLENFTRLTQCYEDLKAGKGLTLDADLWSKILYDFIFTYQSWSRNRRRLVDIITPLYFGRVGTYCREVAEMTNEEAEEVIQRQAKIFERNKEYLLEKLEVWES